MRNEDNATSLALQAERLLILHALFDDLYGLLCATWDLRQKQSYVHWMDLKKSV
jgi:hypothetical protein